MRRATITTAHGDDDAAERVAAAVAPDNTAEMATRVEGEAVVTTVARDGTRGLRSTVDDYVVNCRVADRLGAEGGPDHGTGGESDHETDSTARTDDTDTDTNT
ncbi:KEOPS complex subunit Pcc1 [Halosimplex marinum]|uniref:KEOPS complex subunit Pcc1 n=1 Tax=Halosimplex marinum TaxID=3396620 RepID=UPI003F54D671